MSGNWDSGTSEPVPIEGDRLCLTTLRPIHIPAMRTKGIPTPSPTPRSTLMVSVLGLAIVGDVGVEDVEVVSELLCGGVLEVKIAITLVVEEADDVEAVDELELDEL